MIPLAIFLLACATVFLGAIEAAFSALMRLSLRLMAERGGRSDRLGRYLDDPLQLFVPVRILIATATVLAGALLARLIDVHDAGAVVILIVSLTLVVSVCEHFVPWLLVRRDPEQALDFLLPAFEPIARAMRPLTAAVSLVGTRRDRDVPAATPAEPD